MEELVFAARHYDFPGSYAFHDWTLEQLAAEFNQGNPVVLSLEISGPDQPGHFVTLTGLAEDGSWVRVNDPLRGEVRYSREEFQELWSLQGCSGLVPQHNSIVPDLDPFLPWMGVFSALSMLGLMMTQAGAFSAPRFITDLRKRLSDPRRKGIGGGLLPPEILRPNQVPRYEYQTVFKGYKTIQQEVPVYETREVKVGFRGVKRYIPQYEDKKVLSGYQTITEKVPKYEQERVLVGYKTVTETEPVYEYQQVQVGTKTVSRQVPEYETVRVPIAGSCENPNSGDDDMPDVKKREFAG